jgi:hypothetical protein
MRLIVKHEMNIQVSRWRTIICSGSVLPYLRESVDELEYEMDNPYYVYNSINHRMFNAAVEVMELIEKLRGRTPETGRVVMNPLRDWALFTTRPDGQIGEVYTTQELNRLDREGVKCEVYRELLCDYIEVFEKLRVLPVGPNAPMFYMDTIESEIVSCVDYYRDLESQYKIHLEMLKGVFSLLRNKSFPQVAEKQKVEVAPEPIEETCSLATNVMRRAFEFVVR